MATLREDYLNTDHFVPNGSHQPPYFNSEILPILQVVEGVVVENPNVNITQRQQTFEQLQAARYNVYSNTPNPTNNNFTNINNVQTEGILAINLDNVRYKKVAQERKVYQCQCATLCKAKIFQLLHVSPAITQATGLANGQLIPYPHSTEGGELLHSSSCGNTTPTPLIQLTESQVFPGKFRDDGEYETDPVVALKVREGLVHCTNFHTHAVNRSTSVGVYDEHADLCRFVMIAWEYGMFDLEEGLDFKPLLATLLGMSELYAIYSCPNNAVQDVSQQRTRLMQTLRNTHNLDLHEAGVYFARTLHCDGDNEQPSPAGLLDGKEQILRVLEILQCMIEQRLRKYNRITVVNGALSRWGGDFVSQETERFMKDPLYLMSPVPQEVVDAINAIELNEQDNNISMLGITPNFRSIEFQRSGQHIPSELHIITIIYILSRLYMLPPLPTPYQNSKTKDILCMLLGRKKTSVHTFFTARRSMTLRGVLHPPVLKDVDGDLLKKIIKYLGNLVDDYLNALVEAELIDDAIIPTIGEEDDDDDEDEDDEEGMPNEEDVAAYMAEVYGDDEDDNDEDENDNGRGTGGRNQGGGGTGGSGRGGTGGSGRGSTGGSGRGSTGGFGRGGGGTGGRRSNVHANTEESSENSVSESDEESGMGPNRYVERPRTPERRSIRRKTSH